MATITVKPNQSMQDVILMACGTMDGAMAFCHANGVRISDVPEVGTAYIVPADIARDEDVLVDLYGKGIQLGTLNADPSPPSDSYYGVILYPMMDADVVSPGMTGGYDLKLTHTPEFVHAFGLPDPWPEANIIVASHKDTYESLGMPAGGDISPFATLQSARETRYFIGAGLGITTYLFWSDLITLSTATATFEDVAGWRASCAPLVVLQNTGGFPVVNTLLGTMTLGIEEVGPGLMHVSVTTGHTPITIPDFVLVNQTMRITHLSGGTTVVWPSVWPLGSTEFLPVAPGKYEVGLTSAYENTAGTVVWPPSYLSMIIEIY